MDGSEAPIQLSSRKTLDILSILCYNEKKKVPSFLNRINRTQTRLTKLGITEGATHEHQD